MNIKEFKSLRKKMNKTQHQMAQLLGVSVKSIRSYEQGWRNIPTHVERQMLLLASNMGGGSRPIKSCWVLNKCPSKIKKQCPAWEFQASKFCWFINGTICHGIVHKNWEEKIKLCRSCEVFKSHLNL